jgi:phenylacetate-coenzyme A ligase PaaK-like adenylate-forming protein
MIELNGEFCPIDLLQFFKKAFPKQQVVNMYGMQEFNGIAYSENDKNEFTVLSDNVFVEVLNNNNQQCAINEEGDIVITTLVNAATPLIRYKTGDVGYFNEDLHLIITRARCNDTIEINGNMHDGSVFWSFIDILNEKYCHFAVSQFQVEYTGEVLLFNLVTLNEELSSEDYKCYLEKILRENDGWSEMKVRVNLVPKIDVFALNNKIKYFINHTI